MFLWLGMDSCSGMTHYKLCTITRNDSTILDRLLHCINESNSATTNLFVAILCLQLNATTTIELFSRYGVMEALPTTGGERLEGTMTEPAQLKRTEK